MAVHRRRDGPAGVAARASLPRGCRAPPGPRRCRSTGGRALRMLARRLIPCLDVAAGRVVKGVHFESLRDAGDPVEQAARYDAEGADELVFLDITASHERRDTTADMVS